MNKKLRNDILKRNKRESATPLIIDNNSSNINSLVDEDLLSNLSGKMEALAIIRERIIQKFGLRIPTKYLLDASIMYFIEFMSSDEGLEYYLYSEGMIF